MGDEFGKTGWAECNRLRDRPEVLDGGSGVVVQANAFGGVEVPKGKLEVGKKSATAR
jgi:hypothetical protein